MDSPLLVEIPHGSTHVDPVSARWITTPVNHLAFGADLYLDELFARVPSAGATLLVATLSRYVIDLNTQPRDLEAEQRSENRQGLSFRIRRTPGVSNDSREEPIPWEELARRQRTYFQPYHQALQRILNRKRARFGFAVMLCVHSQYTHKPIDDGSPAIADLNPGTQGRSTAASPFIDVVDQAASRRAWSVAHDDPHAGGYTTTHYGRPDQQVHAIQIEINRRIYMDQISLEPSEDGFKEVEDFAQDVTSGLIEVAFQSPPRRVVIA